MPGNILIIGDERDPHISAVIGHLERMNANVFLLNPADGNVGNISYTYSPLRILFRHRGKSISHTDIDAVWWRLKPNIRFHPQNIDEVNTSNFINREWQLSLEPLDYFLQGCFWINKRSCDHMVRNKPFQLYQASVNGFTIPDTIISNNFDSILERSASFREMIYKPLGYFIAGPDKILFSNKLSAGELAESKENVAIAPCIFQQYVDKDFEMRVTIVGKKVFAVKIYSQAGLNSRFDWRRDQFNLKYEAMDLDTVFREKLLQFHELLGLVYGAYDFIVCKDGQYVFLEVNPAGQWMWLERAVHINIAEEIASTLLRR